MVIASLTITSCVTNWMRENSATSNYSTNNLISIVKDSNGFPLTRTRTGLIDFDLSSIPSNATISSAVLYLNALNSRESGYCGLTIQRVTIGWSSGDSNWNTYDGSTGWGTAGCNSSSSDYTTSNQVVAGIAALGWNSYTITAIVSDWIEDKVSDYGLVLRGNQVVDDQSRGVDYASVNHATTSIRPYLVVNYTTPDPVQPTKSPDVVNKSFSSGRSFTGRLGNQRLI